MSEHSTPSEVENPFAANEVKQFVADDTEAGRAIGKMLSLFFLYTVIVMGISTIATFMWVSNPALN